MSFRKATVEERARRIVLSAARDGSQRRIGAAPVAPIRSAAEASDERRRAVVWLVVRGYAARSARGVYHATDAGIAWAKREAAQEST